MTNTKPKINQLGQVTTKQHQYYEHAQEVHNHYHYNDNMNTKRGTKSIHTEHDLHKIRSTEIAAITFL